MRVRRNVYEGPGSHGTLRVSSGMTGVHTVLRAFPEERYFLALFGARERTGNLLPLTISPAGNESDGLLSPGDLGRDLSSVVQRYPDTETVFLVYTEAALLSGEKPPNLALPDNPLTARETRLVTCEEVSPGMGEYEAADLALEELVKAHARPLEKSPTPTVNIFGPPLFGPGAPAEYEEAERLLGRIGVDINARVPLGASVEDLSRLSRAWANLLLYREAGESATLYLQDEFGTPRVTTPMIGAAGTGAALRSIGDLCRLDPDRVQRAVWQELAQTAKLPWYSRLQKPEAFRGIRAAIFGDFTHTIGLGYALAREVGLEVGWAGTYLGHLEQDFLFHASSFTDDSFVTDDPDEVADRIEQTEPDLLVGTHLEEEVARFLDIPFLPLCPPTLRQPFDQRPLMGYSGSSILADTLEDALRRSGERREAPAAPETPWTGEALEELEEVPAFLRGRARRRAEERARELGAPEVTLNILEESRL